MDWLQYANQGATRNKPISDRLVQAMSFLPQMGVTMKVISGGQDAQGEGDRRTGSTRHDHGGAADADFYKDGRKLDWNNPQDRPIFAEIVSQARANGVTGIGAGDDYMGAGRMHVGFGGESAWGAGGKSANAPDWLQAAYGGAPQGQTAPQGAPQGGSPYIQPPQATQPQNQLAAAPQDLEREQFKMQSTLQDPRAFMTRQQPNALAQASFSDNPFNSYLRRA
jgi:hypothetical protein